MQQFRLYLSEATPSKLLLLGLIVGVGGAFGAIFFHLLIIVISSAFYGNHGTDFVNHVSQMPEWQRVLIPTIGGFLVGLFFWITKVSEAEGEGVPEVLKALNFREGNILFAVAPVKVITSALTLGTGGSAGREGPVIQIGSAIGSSIARFFYLKGENRSLLLSAGAAAAIGGTFGAPLAGVMFTLEILKHRPSFFRLGVIVVAAFVGQSVTNLLTSGNGLDFFVPDLQLSNWLLLSGLTLGFGILAAFAAITFGSVLTFSYFIFSKISSSHILRTTLGGFLIGLISLYLPYIHEQAAYPLMVDIVALTSLPIIFLAILFIVKMMATGITLGSGGVGGIFAPALLLGSILGSILAMTLVSYGVLSLAEVPLYVFMGMAAVFAAAVHAPITAMLVIFEITNEPLLILPLLLTCLVAAAVAKAIKPESIYEIHTK